MNKNTPILLFGMPRSGTTWIGKIFDSSPETLYRHEPDSWGALNYIPIFPDVKEAPYFQQAAYDFVASLRGRRKTKVAGSLPLFKKLDEPGLFFNFRRAGVTGVKALSNYFGEIDIPNHMEPDGPLRLVWKSIESTGRLGLCLSAVPESHAIHILRHPCGFVSSVLRGERQKKFQGGNDSEDFGMFSKLCALPSAQQRGLSLDSFNAMTPAQRLAWRWLLINEKAMEDCAGFSNFLPINYDQVCAQPETEAKRMFEFVGLEWNAQTQEFVKASTGADNSAYYSVFKDPLKAANKWKGELSNAQIEEIMAIVQGTLPGRMFEP